MAKKEDEFDNITEEDGDENDRGIGISQRQDDDGDTSEPVIQESQDSKNRRKKRMTIFIAVIVVVVLILAAGVTWMYYNNGNKPIASVSDRNRSSLGIGDNDTSSNNSGINTDFLSQAGVPDYYMELESKMTKDQKSKADDVAVALAPSNTDVALASTASNPNLTDDMSKAYNSDKTMNPNYSYLTADNVSKQIRNDIERIINPIYGGWTALQVKDQITTRSTPIVGFADMFSSSQNNDVAAKVSGANASQAQSLLPLFADWSANDYGGAYADRSYMPIVGTPGVLNCTYNIRGTESDSISCNVVITYHIDMNSGIKTVNRTLTLNYVPNYANNSDNNARRIMLDSVQQK